MLKKELHKMKDFDVIKHFVKSTPLRRQTFTTCIYCGVTSVRPTVKRWDLYDLEN